ncbi:molybdopterin-guanine dinucleotide biosynthesis protein B [Fictibacillus sp. NRS-1165]|uniref:molybdopterin-guanine dinucleotide biosynthesis protein B n=1 Tax=Fictibacillus sp. NRS-1165 TaxID=3144463 RepID=UPI003D1C9755
MAMGSGSKVQVIGYKNSGKTTLITNLLEAAAKGGTRTGTLKHHGHGGRVEFRDEETDTSAHRNAGAVVSGIEGGNAFQLCLNMKVTFTQLLAFYDPLNLDLLLIEGFKEHQLPRIVILKDDEDVKLIEDSEKVLAVIAWPPVSKELISADLPFFRIGEKDRYIEFLVDLLKGMNT